VNSFKAELCAVNVKKLLCACHVDVQYMAALNIIMSWVFAYRK